MQAWETTAAWGRFKAVFDEAARATSLSWLGKLEAGAARVAPELPRLLPGEPDAAGPLAAALRDRLADRRRGLEVPRGRLPRPDWHADAVRGVERLDHAAAALRALRARGGGDPWIEGSLAPAVAHDRAVLEAALASLEKQLPADPRTPALAARAREALAAAAR